jgi:hypothetical protein
VDPESERSERPAFYALSPGGWHDYWTLLHFPYTVWHLSYVAIGAAVAPILLIGNLGYSLLGFFLGVGVAAHALDELRGRPLRTRIPSGVLVGLAAASLAGAAALGVLGMVRVSPWFAAFIAVGIFLALSYNLELFGGAFHTDLWFALGWGAFPALTGYFAQTGTIQIDAVIVAGGCAVLSAAQRALSTPVRRLRRSVEQVEGTILLADGTSEPLDEGVLRRAPERALGFLPVAMALLAIGLVWARLD